jgi:hypothetical protein
MGIAHLGALGFALRKSPDPKVDFAQKRPCEHGLKIRNSGLDRPRPRCPPIQSTKSARHIVGIGKDAEKGSADFAFRL